jgi:hypothetical protein
VPNSSALWRRPGTWVLTDWAAHLATVPSIAPQLMRFKKVTTSTTLRAKLPDAGEVVVVVFGDKKEVIDQTHGLLEARVEQCAG